jgi:hypothetical protein
MSQLDSKYECVLNRPPGPRVDYNTVHMVKNRIGARGLEIKCNWRYWGISISWGDTNVFRLAEDRKSEVCVAWFVGCHIGPLFFIYAWPKRA